MTKHAQAVLESIHPLDIILDTIDSGADLTTNSLTCLKIGLRQWRHGLSLDRAFSVPAKSKKAQRNDLLRHYAQSLDAPKDWKKSQLILDQLTRLNSGLKCSPMILQANQFCKIPTSQRQILRIITDRKTY